MAGLPIAPPGGCRRHARQCRAEALAFLPSGRRGSGLPVARRDASLPLRHGIREGGIRAARLGRAVDRGGVRVRAHPLARAGRRAGRRREDPGRQARGEAGGGAVADVRGCPCLCAHRLPARGCFGRDRCAAGQRDRDRRRAGHHGGRQPRRIGSRRTVDRLQHHPAARTGPQWLVHAGADLPLPLLRHAQDAPGDARQCAGGLPRRLRHLR